MELTASKASASLESGWILLFFGWPAAFNAYFRHLGGAGWFANPCFVFGTLALLYGERRIAAVLMFAAAVIAPLSFLLKDVSDPSAAGMVRIVGQEIGFWVWIASIWFNSVIALFTLILPGHPKAAGQKT